MALLRKFTKRLCIFSNCVVVAIFLLSCANAVLPPGKWWIISLLAPFFPLLLLLVLGFFVFWLFFYSRRLALISLAALIVGWPNVHALFAFHSPRSFEPKKGPGILRVMTWNIRRWDEFITKKPGASGHGAKMLEFIRDMQADVVCLQEFFDATDPRNPGASMTYILHALGYRYFLVSRDYPRKDGSYETGNIIFSRFPITDTLIIKYAPGAPGASESLVRADINVNGKTIRVFTTHLQSVMFGDKEFRDMRIIRNVDDSVLEASKSIAKKLRRANSLRRGQADQVRTQLDQSPFPLIICGDFNDLPNSYCYFQILGDRQDAFIAGGFGIGRTYVRLSPTLRIDYILTDRRLKVAQCMPISLPYSDHHPVVADLELP